MVSLVLFDIDGTLVTRADAHVRAKVASYEEIYGLRITTRDGKPGQTDVQIAIADLTAAGLSVTEIMEKIDACKAAMIRHYLTLLPEETAEPLPGVPQLLWRLKEAGATLGLVTGNLQRIAYAKLERIGLGKYFALGGFGSDALERSDLVKHALKLAGNVKRATHVGDTPNDVAAARSAGIRVLGVGTGGFSAAELNADHYVDDLGDVKQVLKLLL